MHIAILKRSIYNIIVFLKTDGDGAQQKLSIHPHTRTFNVYVHELTILHHIPEKLIWLPL